MLYVLCNEIDISQLLEMNKDMINYVKLQDYVSSSDWPISAIEAIKLSLLKYKITFTDYDESVIICLNALNISHTLVHLSDKYSTSDNNLYLTSEDYIHELHDLYDWINTPKLETANNEEVALEVSDKSKLSFEKLLDDNTQITDSDVREFKVIENKLKVGLILQAKSSLKRILKMSNILDKLYDELFDRIDTSLATSDTASLMYTTEYISKALADTNQFIMSLVNNEKIQNFFIIDNSNVVNIGNDAIDANKRERIRKAAEIVMSNLDYFESGEYEKFKDPNIIDAEEVDNNGNTST